MPTVSYQQARAVVLGFGTVLIAAIALAAFLRGADPVEVGAIVLFVPVLVGLAYGHARGGLLAAVLASIVYVGVRFATLGALDPAEFVAAAFVRVLLYTGLGLFGGWANAMLEHALRKLELYDEIDDATGVGNARALLSIADRETARAARYGSVFSIALLSVDRPAFDAVDERAALRALRRLCQSIEQSVRRTDLVSRVPLDRREDVAIVLPETGREGATQFTDRLVERAREHLESDGVLADGHLRGEVLTVPGDEERLRSYQHEIVRALDAALLGDAPTEGTA
ncbi:MAG: GGDEF domain-containing protein [Actinobacteria bacterium]|nr:GGDEF domain-containing protein [Actinomycetota bacterium]